MTRDQCWSPLTPITAGRVGGGYCCAHSLNEIPSWCGYLVCVCAGQPGGLGVLCATLTSIGRATSVDIALLLRANDACHCNTGAMLSNLRPTQADPVCEVNFLLAVLTCRDVINSSSHKNSLGSWWGIFREYANSLLCSFKFKAYVCGLSGKWCQIVTGTRCVAGERSRALAQHQSSVVFFLLLFFF